jgi:7-cyano-7-deazaguanine tRNA-ribosyltransferase
MSFELRDRDLLGRIGRLKTKRGYVETPSFMPVVNPISQAIHPKRMREEFGCDIIITNSYIIKMNADSPDLEIHRFLDYDGVVVTDSGAYQILVYGEIETTSLEIIEFQQRIGSDIAVILDIPTGWDIPRSRVEWTVDETLRRAEAALPIIEGSSTLWVGPVQGGTHLDLVKRSAQSIGAMPYHLHALGSPTVVMQAYKYSLLVDMVMTAKLNLPIERPLHLFGAGHPMMFSLAVALGCDLFDSASYAIFAKKGRYLTPRGTMRLKELRYLPCSCPVCRRLDAEEFQNMLKGERVRTLTEHNLHICMSEIDVVKQAISEGTLWELLESRSRGHPSLTSALRRLKKYKNTLERTSPSFKGRGFFYFDFGGLARPEITRHANRIKERYVPPKDTKKLLLVCAPRRRPFNRSDQYRRLEAALKTLENKRDEIHICFYSAPFGVVPLELSETYPLSQFEVAEPLDSETLDYTAKEVSAYVADKNFDVVVLHSGSNVLDEIIESNCRQTCTNMGKSFFVISSDRPWSDEALNKLSFVFKHMEN